MDTPITMEAIQHIENYLGQGDFDAALPELLEMRDAAEDYIKEACVTTDEVQYFCFANAFERLAYRRVEKDPRGLVQVGAPLDRMYADLAFVYINQQEYALARDALKQAVRWNPMNCKYRLDLAEIFRALGDIQEWAALSNSVLERASDGRVAARAYSNLGQLFIDQDNAVAASGCARLAVRLAPADARTVALMDRLAKEHPEVAKDSDDHVMGELSIQGIPTSPSADVAICLLICASDAAMAGDRARAAEYTARANGLIGKEACSALIKMIREADNEGGANAQ